METKIHLKEGEKDNASVILKGADMKDLVFVVDEVQVENLDKIKPNDIESISVIKGPNAAQFTSIYGEKATNGIIKVKTKKAKTAEDNDEIFTVVEKQPEYSGGMSAMFDFLKKNIKYPAEAVKNKIQGKVFVTFVVEKNGGLSNISVLKSLDNSCDVEAIRVVNLMPQWIPGSQNGVFVRTKYTLPIDFKLK